MNPPDNTVRRRCISYSALATGAGHVSRWEEKLETNTRPANASWIAGIRSVCISIKDLQLDDEDEAEEGSFRKRRTDFSVGTRVRWLKAAKTFCITKCLYTATGST